MVTVADVTPVWWRSPQRRRRRSPHYPSIDGGKGHACGGPYGLALALLGLPTRRAAKPGLPVRRAGFFGQRRCSLEGGAEVGRSVDGGQAGGGWPCSSGHPRWREALRTTFSPTPLPPWWSFPRPHLHHGRPFGYGTFSTAVT